MKTKRIVFSVLGLAVCSAMIVHPFDQTQKNTYAYFNTPDINTTLVNDTAFTLGDVNGDMAVNADDASVILAEYAVVSTSNRYTFSEEQFKAGDVNADGAVDVADASLVLSYYAYTSTGGNISIEEHIKLPAAPPVTTTSASAVTTTQTTATTTVVSSTEVISTEPPDIPPYKDFDEYTINEITYDKRTYYKFCQKLNENLLNKYQIITYYNGKTDGYVESLVALAILNNGEINDDVLQYVLEYTTREDLSNGMEYLFNMRGYIKRYGTDIDFTKYIVNQDIANFLNEMKDADNNGTIDEFMNDKYVEGNIPDEYLENAGIWCVCAAYSIGEISFDGDFVKDYIMNDFLDELYNRIHGSSEASNQ